MNSELPNFSPVPLLGPLPLPEEQHVVRLAGTLTFISHGLDPNVDAVTAMGRDASITVRGQLRDETLQAVRVDGRKTTSCKKEWMLGDDNTAQLELPGTHRGSTATSFMGGL